MAVAANGITTPCGSLQDCVEKGNRMRLTCPGCMAQYEVDDSVIPDAGRDVQCSACGTTWFQYPEHIARQMREMDLDDDDEDGDESESGDAAGPDRDGDADRSQGAGSTRVDKTVLDLLREEAERELALRRRESGIESQPDLGLEAGPRRPSRPRPQDDPAGARVPPGSGDGARTRRRRELPDIEELSSSLDPSDEPRQQDGADVTLPPTDRVQRRGFRGGLVMALFLVLFLIILYMFAPVIGALVPPLQGVMAGYVAAADALRGAIAGVVGGLLGR
jgi:predicted Zn finger-like uncharacterized protein